MISKNNFSWKGLTFKAYAKVLTFDSVLRDDGKYDVVALVNKYTDSDCTQDIEQTDHKFESVAKTNLNAEWLETQVLTLPEFEGWA